MKQMFVKWDTFDCDPPGIRHRCVHTIDDDERHNEAKGRNCSRSDAWKHPGIDSEQRNVVTLLKKMGLVIIIIGNVELAGTYFLRQQHPQK